MVKKFWLFQNFNFINWQKFAKIIYLIILDYESIREWNLQKAHLHYNRKLYTKFQSNLIIISSRCDVYKNLRCSLSYTYVQNSKFCANFQGTLYFWRRYTLQNCIAVWPYGNSIFDQPFPSTSKPFPITMQFFLEGGEMSVFWKN